MNANDRFYARDAHVDPLALERDPLAHQQPALAPALGQRPVGTDDPVPRNPGVGAVVQHGPAHPRGSGGDVAVGAHEPLRGRAHPLQDRLGPLV